MEQEFVPYTVALKLKELGFDEPCFAWYVSENYGLVIGRVIKSNLIMDAVLAPTFLQAFRWFRETHDLDGEAARYNLSNIEAKLLGVNIKETKFVYLAVINGEDFPELEDITLFMSREEAELACLIKLIKIVEEK